LRLARRLYLPSSRCRPKRRKIHLNRPVPRAGTTRPSSGTTGRSFWQAWNAAAGATSYQIDRRAAGLTLAASSSYISPNGDRQADQTTLSWAADERISGTARMLGRDNATVRRWTVAGATAGSWVWNGKNAAGATVADGRYTLRLVGLDRAGNQTTRDLQVRVDRTIRSLAWARSAFTPRAGQKDRFTLVLRRKATVTVAIYQGSTLVRRIWTGRALAAGTYGWTMTVWPFLSTRSIFGRSLPNSLASKATSPR